MRATISSVEFNALSKSLLKRKRENVISMVNQSACLTDTVKCCVINSLRPSLLRKLKPTKVLNIKTKTAKSA